MKTLTITCPPNFERHGFGWITGCMQNGMLVPKCLFGPVPNFFLVAVEAVQIGGNLCGFYFNQEGHGHLLGLASTIRLTIRARNTQGVQLGSVIGRRLGAHKQMRNKCLLSTTWIRTNGQSSTGQRIHLPFNRKNSYPCHLIGRIDTPVIL